MLDQNDTDRVRRRRTEVVSLRFGMRCRKRLNCFVPATTGGTEGEKRMKDYEKLSREHFDEMADNYAATDGRYYTPLPVLACDEAAALLKGERFGAMLDVGCGSGRLLFVLSAEHPSASLFGLDISPKMLAHAREKTAGCPRVTLVEGGAGSLPFPDGSFGAVTCIMSFHHYPYPERAVEEAFRVLGEGGLYILSDVDGSGGGTPGEEEFKLHTADEAENLLRGAGFRVEVKRMLTPSAFFLAGRK